MHSASKRAALLPLVTFVLSTNAVASERRFTYTYESLTLGPGQIEVEPWTTLRGGRDGYYVRFDERIELEFGVADGLQTAWYLNAKAIAEEQPHGAIGQKLEFGGVSNEWKWKLLDPTADVFGLALYGEWTAAPAEAELEGKLIVDKRFGDFVAAVNLVGEVEWELEEADELESEVVLEVDGALGYMVTDQLSLGIELRNHNEVVADEGWEHSVLFAGPALSYASQSWWAALTVLPQVADLLADGDALQNVDEHERIEARVLLGFHL